MKWALMLAWPKLITACPSIDDSTPKNTAVYCANYYHEKIIEHYYHAGCFLKLY